MRTLLICHHDAALDREGLVRWLASFSDFAGAVVVHEPRQRLRKRIARELKRVGIWRFLDVVAFRVVHRLRRGRRDRHWEAGELERLRALFPRRPNAPEVLVSSPNSAEAEAFIRAAQPDLVVARCKTLLKDRVFEIPRLGTYVLHPGICPEYRNAHGCFWALASGDRTNVGMTLLRIDRGVDTGPIFGHFRVNAEDDASHVVVQHRVVFEHLDAIRATLLAIDAGTATSIDTSGHASAAWGQPWLSAQLRLLLRARKSERRTSKALKLET